MKVISKIENFFAMLFFLSGIGISLYGVFSRYVLGQSHSWTTEIYTMLLVWAIFIGFSTALRDDKHIAIDILYDRVGSKTRKIFEVIILIIGIAFSTFFMWTGYEMVLTSFEQGHKTIDAGFSIWISYLAMPVAGVLLLIRSVERAVRVFLNKTTSTEEEAD